MTACLLRSIQQRIPRSLWPPTAALLVIAAVGGFGEVRAQPVVWEQVGVEATIVKGLAFDEADTLWALGSSVSWGLRHMPPGSDTWTEVSEQDGIGLMFTDAGSIITTTVAGLARSTDRGRTFEDLFQPAGGGLYRVRGGPLAGRLFAGVRAGDDPNGAAFSTDDGQTWTHAPIRRLPQHSGGAALAFVAVENGPNAGRVVAACYDGLAYTDDGGASWATSSLWAHLGYIVYDVLALSTGSAEGGGRRLLASVDGGGAADVWFSDDDGATWAPLAGLGPGGAGVRLLYVGVTEAGPETVYAVGGFSEVWRSGDGGQTWAALGNVYPEATTFVKDAIVGPDGRLYVAQNQAGPGDPSNGVYRTVEPVTVASEVGPAKVEASRLSVYPNPSAGMATVTLTLAEAGDVRVAAFDVLGREVAVLHDGRLGVGEHRLAFDGLALPVGAYMVRATGNGLSVTQPMTVLR